MDTVRVGGVQPDPALSGVAGGVASVFFHLPLHFSSEWSISFGGLVCLLFSFNCFCTLVEVCEYVGSTELYFAFPLSLSALKSMQRTT